MIFCRPLDARSNVLTFVESCSEGVMALAVRYGKNPWFSRNIVLSVSGVDRQRLISMVVDGEFFLI